MINFPFPGIYFCNIFCNSAKKKRKKTGKGESFFLYFIYIMCVKGAGAKGFLNKKVGSFFAMFDLSVTSSCQTSPKLWRLLLHKNPWTAAYQRPPPTKHHLFPKSRNGERTLPIRPIAMFIWREENPNLKLNRIYFKRYLRTHFRRYFRTHFRRYFRRYLREYFRKYFMRYSTIIFRRYSGDISEDISRNIKR